MGLFITLEGGEGTGKSTQAQRLAEALRGLGRSVVQTREPGGTSEAERVRDLLVSGATDRWSPEAEALLNYAARDHHLHQFIRPALARGEIVICDRFMDSTRAYQQHAGGASAELVDALEKSIVGATRPDLTLVFDLAPEIGLARARQRGDTGADRYERKGIAFHRRLRAAFLAIAEAEPSRCAVVDAGQPPDAVFAAAWSHIQKVLHG